jgi:hypothetical protein
MLCPRTEHSFETSYFTSLQFIACPCLREPLLLDNQSDTSVTLCAESPLVIIEFLVVEN